MCDSTTRAGSVLTRDANKLGLLQASTRSQQIVSLEAAPPHCAADLILCNIVTSAGSTLGERGTIVRDSLPFDRYSALC